MKRPLDSIRGKLSTPELLRRLESYKFVECDQIISFLTFVVRDEMADAVSYRFIYQKVKECLKHHGSDCRDDVSKDIYLQDLKVLALELEFVISLTY